MTEPEAVSRKQIEDELREKIAQQIWEKHLQTFNFGDVGEVLRIVRGEE